MEKTGSKLVLAARLQFWYQHFVKGEDTFEESLKPVATVASLEDFWAYYQHFKRPTELPVGSYIYLFQEGIKPVWEDKRNSQGGAFVLRFEKAKCNRLWEDILLGYISASKDVFALVNGIRLKVRKDFTEIDFWVGDVEDEKGLEECRRWIVGVTTLENETPLEVIHFHHEE
jgi:translation initiation factor 4E